MMMAADGYYTYTGGRIPPDVTRVRVDKSLTVIPAGALQEIVTSEKSFVMAVSKQLKLVHSIAALL
eukprot:scaffold251_cov78-Skeletonema_dohrnii-CCMP3373.AAC.3